MTDAPERIWARPDYNECWPKRLEEEDVEYIRADLYDHVRRDRDQWRVDCEEFRRERDAALAGAIKVKPLVWKHREGRNGPEWDAICDVLKSGWTAYTEEAKQAIDRHRSSVIRAAIQPDPDARQADLSDAARDVLAERARQISVEGWTPGHDDTHEDGEMAEAAGCYALNAAGWKTEAIRGCWPIKWMAAWFKPTDPRRDLVKAGALCIAEIERLDRALTPPADLAAKIGGAE